MSERNYYLVRSPRELMDKDLIGYGWKGIDFSAHSDVSDVLKEILSKHESYGRKKNQIKRFFCIKSGDIVVVPVPSGIILGIVKGEKSYGEGIKHGENRIAVDFMHNGKFRRVSTRKNLITNSFLSRLRIRQTNTSLKEFAQEIESLLSLTESDQSDFSEVLEKNRIEAEDHFKKELLKNLKIGKDLRIQGGGDGFEKLICEVLQLKGYVAKIASKKSNKGKGDIDIVASKTLFFGENIKLSIQAKHHSGTTSITALKQVLIAKINGEVPETDIVMVISTGQFNAATKAEANNNNVRLIDGDEFVKLWLYPHLSVLSDEILQSLGVSLTPTMMR